MAYVMTGLSRCGRQYRTFDAALMAGELRNSKGARPLAVVSCDLGDHWHLVRPGDVIGSAAYRSPDPFPPAVRKQLVARDECCQRCGHTGRLEAHHRRAKASGGSSARAHTQCACNGVLLCRSCHSDVHLNPRISRANGWIVPQSIAKPGRVGMFPKLFRYDSPTGYEGWQRRGGLVEPVYPTCEGGWNDQP